MKTPKEAPKKRGNPQNLMPAWKPGESGNLSGRPKGRRNFSTDFNIAAREVAEALRLGEEPKKVQIEIVKRGIKEGLKGNFPFWKEIIERLYGDKELPGIYSDKTIVFQIIKDDKANQTSP